MLLAIDAGNSNIVFATVTDGVVGPLWRHETTPHLSAEGYGAWLAERLASEGIAPEALSGAIIACVVPQVLPALKALCESLCGTPPLVVGEAGTDLGIRIDIEAPGDVGADRLVNVVAAHAETGGAAVVIDFGTATTFDIAGEDGAYLGGVIAPGIRLSLKALYDGAAQLPLIEVAEPEGGRVTGGSTLTAMQSGVFWGYIGLVEGIMARLREEHGSELPVIATGGLAPLFAGHTEAIGKVDGALTIKGLAIIAARNGVGS